MIEVTVAGRTATIAGTVAYVVPTMVFAVEFGELNAEALAVLGSLFNSS